MFMSDISALDIDELLKSARCVKDYFVNLGIGERKPILIFVALLDRTIEYAEAGVATHEFRFDAMELCKASMNDKPDYQAAKDFVKRHQKAFDKLVKDNIEGISHQLKLVGAKYIPYITNTESAGAHRSEFYIALKPLNEEKNHQVTLKAKGCEIVQYNVSQLPKAETWIKPLLKLKVTGWKYYLYLGLPLALVISVYLMFLVNLTNFNSTNLSISIIALSVIWVFYMALKPFYSAMMNRVEVAPPWLTSLKSTNVQIRAVKIEQQNVKLKPNRQLELVVHSASCPICSASIYIEKGKAKFKDRLIGVCDESPREHIFSFDHITKTGKLLR